MDEAKLCGILEAILFVAGDPVPIRDLAHALNLTESELMAAVERLRDHCDLESAASASTGLGGMLQLSYRRQYRLCGRVPPARAQGSRVQAGWDAVFASSRHRRTSRPVRGVKCDYSVGALNKALLRGRARKRWAAHPLPDPRRVSPPLRHPRASDLPMAALGRSR